MRCLSGRQGIVLLLLLADLFFFRGDCMAALRIVIFDVGMGQSILLEENGHGLLIDTGVAEQAPPVLRRLEAYGVKSLDYLILTHLHPDHAAGYPAVREAWPQTLVRGNCHDPESVHSTEQESFEKVNSALQRDPLYGCLIAGDTLHWQKQRIDVLWPDTLQDKGNLNLASLVLLITSEEGRRLLIMGDVDQSVDLRLMPSLSYILRGESMDLLVAAHHAAADSSNPEFIKILSPVFSVVSVGANNPYGYPAEKSMAVLEQYSQTVLRTDKVGEICFMVEKTGVMACEPLAGKKGGQ